MSQIRHKSVQNEKTKQARSIPQASRFYSVGTDPVPGPGRYSPRDPRDPWAPGVKFSMNKQTSLYHVSESPAPGSYDLPSTFKVSKRVDLPAKARQAEAPVTKSLSLSCKIPINLHESFEFTQTSARRAVFGSEKRRDNFLNGELVKNPGPGEYSQGVAFGQGPRWRFGSELSRKFREVEEFPGPGAYNAPSTLISRVFRFASGRKPERVDEQPGPGQYNVMKNSQYSSFAFSKAEKFQKFLGPALPGPSDYRVQDCSARQTTSECTRYKLNNSSSVLTTEIYSK